MLRLAIKNIQRNKKRTFLTVLSIFFAAMIVGLAQGWVNGMLDLYIDMYVNNQTGHVRIATEEFIKREKFMPVEEYIPHVADLAAEIEKIPGITSVEERIRFAILLASGDNTVDSIGVGLNLDDNRYNLKEKMVQGSLGGSGLYIGHELAKRLGVTKGDELLVATKTSQGGLNGIKLTIEGIFKLNNTFYDRRFFFIGLDDARKLLKMGDGATELMVFGEKNDDATLYRDAIIPLLPSGLKAQDFKEQLGDFYGMISAMKYVYLVIEALILFLASFVIVNTMMMNIFERIREIGTMKALGMTDRQVFWSITLEGAVMGAIGGVLGATVGFLIIAVLAANGINLESYMQGLDMPFDYILKPTLTIWHFLGAVIISILVPALAAMIPARYSNKLMPAEALRK